MKFFFQDSNKDLVVALIRPSVMIAFLEYLHVSESFNEDVQKEMATEIYNNSSKSFIDKYGKFLNDNSLNFEKPLDEFW